MKRLDEINIIRAIMCILVVMTHAITNFLRNVEVDLKTGDQYIIWFRFALLCATPIFILLSETLISRNYATGLKKGFFLKRIKYILLPYILIGLFVSYRSSDGSWASFLEIAINKVVLGNWYGFFVIVIFQFYILHWLIGKYLAKINPFIPLFLSFVVSYMHVYSFVNIQVYQDLIVNQYPFWYKTHIFMWLFYFIAAFYIGQYYETLMNFLVSKIWLPIVASVLTYLVIMYNYYEVGYTRVSSERYDMLLFSVSIFFMLVTLIRKYELSSKTLIMISHFSFYIYLTHLIILPYFVKLSLTFGENFFSYIFIMTFLTISTSIGWAILYYQYKLTRLATGRIVYLEDK